jgi:hypothetical protein
VLNLAFDQSPSVRRVSIHAGLQPGSEHLWIAAQHQPDPALPYASFTRSPGRRCIITWPRSSSCRPELKLSRSRLPRVRW